MFKTKNAAQRAYAIVTEIVNEWDPYGLLAMGAPPDEFGPEIADVVARLPEVTSATEGARVLSEVFGRWFHPEDFPIEGCTEPGYALYLALQAQEW